MKVSNGFYSLDRMADAYLSNQTYVKKQSDVDSNPVVAFQDILQSKQKTETNTTDLVFSKHANERLANRNIELNEEQMNLVSEFLMSQKVEVSGYTGSSRNSEEEKDTLSQQEKDYVAEYLIDIEKMPKTTENEVTLAYYLPKVVEEAVRFHTPGVFIGDVIQEGNVSLMMYLSEKEKTEESEVLEQVRAGIRMMLEAHTEEKRRDNKMVERVSDLDETIQSMKEEYGRKVSVDEVAERMGITEDAVEDILKLAGEEVKDEE